MSARKHAPAISLSATIWRPRRGRTLCVADALTIADIATGSRTHFRGLRSQTLCPRSRTNVRGQACTRDRGMAPVQRGIELTGNCPKPRIGPRIARIAFWTENRVSLQEPRIGSRIPYRVEGRVSRQESRIGSIIVHRVENRVSGRSSRIMPRTAHPTDHRASCQEPRIWAITAHHVENRAFARSSSIAGFLNSKPRRASEVFDN
jgi:hypothetical protein